MTHPLNAFVVIVLIAILIAAAYPLIIPQTGEDLAKLPWTQHAKEAHDGQVWDVTRIMPVIAARNCEPIYSWACPGNILKLACPITPGSDLWIGLILGSKVPGETPVIITGFAARSMFWMQSAARDGCTVMVIP